MKSKLEKQLLDELKAPELKEQIKARMPQPQVEPKRVKRKNYAPRFAVAFLLVASIIGVVFGIGLGKEPVISNTVCVISINPAIELTADASNVIIGAKPLNEDGVKQLMHTELVGMTLDDGAAKVVELANKYGYLKDKGVVRLTTTNGNAKFNEKVNAAVKAKVNNVITTAGINSSILDMTKAELEKLEDYFDKLDIDKIKVELDKDFEKQIRAALDNKIYTLGKLIALLEPYSNEDNEEVIAVEEFKAVRVELKKYLTDYKLKLGDLIDQTSLEKLTYADVFELLEEFDEDKAELEKCKRCLENGGDSEDYEDLLEDLFEIVKDLIISDKN